FMIIEKWNGRVTGKLVVSLINDNQTTSRFQQLHQFLVFNYTTGRIIRRTNDRDVWLRFLNRLKQRCHIKLKITVERNTRYFAAQNCRDLPVECKGGLGNENAFPLSNSHH